MINKERIKSFLLAFLVLTTIYLIQQLWVEFPDELFSSLAFGQESTDVKESMLSDFILPEKYTINFGGNNRAIMYFDETHGLWNKGKEILKEAFQSKNIKIEEMTDEEFEEIRKKRAIGFYFPNDIHTFIFGKVFDADISSSINESIKKINSIYIYLDSLRDNFIIISDGKNYIKISGVDFNFENIKDEIDIISKTDYTRVHTVTDLLDPDIKNNTYIPLQVKFNLSQVYVRKEIDISSELEEDNIAALFFNRDLAYIRRIEENDGSVIYIDSQRTLKIHENGTLEFFKSIEANAETGNLYMSLKNAIDFIDTHMGWPDDTYLYKVDEIEFENNKGYRFTFKYKLDGLTVISDENQTLSSIEIEMFNNQVKSYRRPRHIWREIGKVTPKGSYKNMLSAYDIIVNNYNFIKIKFIENNNINVDTVSADELDKNVNLAIKDACLAYYDNSAEENQVLKPVWIINVAGFSYVFDAYDGSEENGGNPR
ncbi:two-component system activity regulator YycH [Proteiniborus sp. MB09-C3]|uniref:two-component system activity regulator YycH n=1 Tax=Proteiniborus sp. MB09-C3 TaxID=3050072 RepID=UPI0025577D2F|nr:two-component system activity regulator YycH [Proteiniborus sp. MB09-C3]WIV12505.1 two-component system activity regulator YycH [Proteiniborus sp. MB09-C3]